MPSRGNVAHWQTLRRRRSAILKTAPRRVGLSVANARKAATLMELVLTSCVVRDWKPGDVDSLVRHANDRSVWRNMTHTFPHPYTEQDARDWLEFVRCRSEPTHWAIDVDGNAVGGIGLILGDGIFSHSASLGYWLGKNHRGRGIMTEAVAAVAEYAPAHFGLCRLQADVFAWNPASMRVLEKCGFTREGVARLGVYKDGELVDQIHYGLVDCCLEP